MNAISKLRRENKTLGLKTLGLKTQGLDVCRSDFPALAANDQPAMAYFDSSATTLRPSVVVDAMRWYLEKGTASVHRGVHRQSIEATNRFEATRESLAGWIGADRDEVIFTGGATSAIHLVRHGLRNLKHVAITVMEHHSNLLPWMDLDSCTVVPVDEHGSINIEALKQTLIDGVDLLAVSHASNVLGCVTPIKELTQLAHQHGAKILVDAAQSASHHPIDVKELEIDFLVCSSHKMLGPSGVGALFASRKVHDQLAPVFLGGQMVDQVTKSGWTPQPPPYCFEAGSPPVESVIGWGAAIAYLEEIGHEAIGNHLSKLTNSLMSQLTEVPGVRILGPKLGTPRAPLVSFHLDGIESHAIARILSQRENVLVRSGFQCAQPLHEHLGLKPSVRASLQIYNNQSDIDRLIRTLQSIAKLRNM